MSLLMRCELKRFSRLTAIVATIHLAALFLLGRVSDPLRWNAEDQLAILVVFMLLGATLAAVQVGAYRRPSQWLWLIHRPLQPRTIFADLGGSALAILGTALGMPAMFWLAATDGLTARVVDLRDYVSVIHLLAFAWMAWAITTLTLLSRSKWLIVCLVLPLLIILKMTSVWWLFIPVIAGAGWLWAITRETVRANRQAPIASNGILMLTALPLQLGLFLLIFHVGKGTVEAVQFLAKPPVAGDIVTEKDVASAPQAPRDGLIAQGLVNSTHPLAPSWRAQLPLLPGTYLSPVQERFPVRHQFGNTVPTWWDAKHGTEWTYSHDAMRFIGRDPRSGQARGAWGPGGAWGGAESAFDAIPLEGLTRDTLYAIDSELQRQFEQLKLPRGEWFVARPSEALGRVWVMSNNALRVHHPADPEMPPGTPLRADWLLPYPEDAARLTQIDIAQLLDGWLVSFFYFDPHDRVYVPWQQVVHVDADGRSRVVGERHGIRDLKIHIGVGGSALLPTEAWWLSPSLHVLASAADRALDTGLTRPPALEPLPRSPALWAAALALSAFSFALGALWLKGCAVTPPRKRLWLTLCALVGLPALLSIPIFEARKVVGDAAP